MTSKVIRALSILSILPILAIVFFATRASSDPPPPTEGCVLTIPGIPGESTRMHDGIDLMSFSWGVHNPSKVHSPEPRASIFGDFTVTKRLDKASPLLMLASAEGQRFGSATLVSSADAGVPGGSPFLTVTLSNVLVSDYHSNGSCDGGFPTEQVSFNFGRIRFEYQQQSTDGGVGQPVTTCWDTVQRRRCE